MSIRVFCYGQALNPSSVNSFGGSDFQMAPEAATLARMLNYPVNHSTGVPAISIPLYEVKAGSMTVPLALSYHAGGFRIDERAGHVGLGWALSCDLQITRTINGIDDRYSGGYINNANITASGYTGIGTKEAGYSLAIDNTKDGQPDRFYYKLLNKSGMFFFYRNGSSLTCVPVPYSDIKIVYDTTQDIFIITDTDGTKYQFGIAIANAGTNYADRLTELSSSNPSYSNTVTWKCHKIIAPNNVDEITFSYAPYGTHDGNLGKKNTCHTYRDNITYWNMFYDNFDWADPVIYPDNNLINNVTIFEYLIDNSHAKFYRLSSPRYMLYSGGRPREFHLPYIPQGGTEVIDNSYSSNSPSIGSTDVNVYGLNIIGISYRGGQIQFSGYEDNGSAGSAHLNQIVISEYGQTRSINLYQHRVNSYGRDNYTYYLDSVRIGADIYRFRYHTIQPFGSYVKGQDAWGFANHNTFEFATNTGNPIPFLMPKIQGTVKTRHLVNPVPYKFYFGGNYIMAEEPNESRMKRGVLRQIIYPDGGFTNFDYEPNRYYAYKGGSYYPVMRMSSGLRIRSIAHFSNYTAGVQADRQLYYVYGEHEDGSGKVIRPPQVVKTGQTVNYIPYSYSQIINYVTTNYDQVCVGGIIHAKDSMTNYLPASSLDCTYSDGAPVYYTKVTEYQIDKGIKSGKTVYEYYPEQEFIPQISAAIAPWDATYINGTNIPYIKTNWYIGAPKSVSEYRFENGRFHLEHQKTFQYQLRMEATHPVVAYAFTTEFYQTVKMANAGTYLYNFPYLGNVISLESGPYQGNVANFYEFGISGTYRIPVGQLLMTQENEIWFKTGQTIAQTTCYTYGNPTYSQPTQIKTRTSEYTRIRTLKYPYDYTTGVLTAMKNRNMISPVIEEWTVDSASNTEIARAQNSFRLNSGSTATYVLDNMKFSVKADPLVNYIECLEYDQYGNIIRLRKDDNLKKNYIWGYNARYPIAEITGTTAWQNSTNTSLFYNITSEVQNLTDEAALKSSLKSLHEMEDVLVALKTYKPLAGTSWLCNSAREEIVYDYDDYGRLLNIRDENNQILRQFGYHYKIPPDLSPDTLSFLVPRMETYFDLLSDTLFGKYIAYNEGGIASSSESVLPGFTSNQIFIGTFHVDSTAKIVINAGSMYGLVIDFIQDGSIITTHTVHQSTGNILFLPPGDCTVSIKESMKPYSLDNPLMATWTDNNGVQRYFNGYNNTVQLLPGGVYNFTVTQIN
ncbi:MAG: hypothetical protein LBR06_06500 [Bacteroidales bacterium]|jgi:hypothetical protein|nr:hypothetical protein [Bacteroidales bacterium]